jgi:hypothetical protein
VGGITLGLNMIVLVENFRRPPSGDWIATGGWAYQVKTPVDGPIAIEGLQDAVLRYLYGTLDSSDGDCVISSRGDMIDTEPVWLQFVKAQVAAKGHTFSHDTIWVVGNRTEVRVTFVPNPRVAEAPKYLGQQNRQTLPQSIAEGLRFGSPRFESPGSPRSPRSTRRPVYEES